MDDPFILNALSTLKIPGMIECVPNCNEDAKEVTGCGLFFLRLHSIEAASDLGHEMAVSKP